MKAKIFLYFIVIALAGYTVGSAQSDDDSQTPLSAEIQRIEFVAEDGRQLVGDFYPAGVNPAPVVILMHEGLSDRSEMESLALWLQNRPDEIASGPTGKTVFEWMPDFPDQISSLNVFAIDMRGHGESEGPMPPNNQPLGYLMDARAAIALVKSFEGILPTSAMRDFTHNTVSLNGCHLLYADLSVGSACV